MIAGSVSLLSQSVSVLNIVWYANGLRLVFARCLGIVFSVFALELQPENEIELRLVDVHKNCIILVNGK